MLRAGDLRDRVEVQEDQGTEKDQYKQPIPDWQTVETRWANVSGLSGREYWQAQQAQAETTYRVEMRYSARLAALGSKARLVWDGKTLEVESVIDPDGLKERLLLMCHMQG